jgi:shikimate kinase
LATTSDPNIIITGFMGTGKSTVGKLVAEKLGRPFVDTDEEIVKQAGKTIPEIFAQEGEAVFRHMERRICQFLADQCGYVIATGGGMLVDEGNRAVMLASGLVVCLRASPEVIQRRLQIDETERPLLKGDWGALLEKRRAAYDAIPHQIETTDRTPEQIAEDIVGLWQNTST